MSFLNNILVFDTEHTKVRVGDKKDGGYVVLEEVSLETEILYSYGVEYNSSFEGEFVKRFDCDAVLFDHTVDAPARQTKDSPLSRKDWLITNTISSTHSTIT